MPDVVIRDGMATDLPAIVAMHADDPLGQAREDASEPLDARYLEAFEAIQGDAAQKLAVATLSGRAVGCLQLTVIPGLSRLGARRGLIEGVRVAGGHRGQGVGEAMVAWAIDAARASGCRLVQLTTDRSRKQAHRFYEKLGFKPSHVGMKLDLSTDD